MYSRIKEGPIQRLLATLLLAMLFILCFRIVKFFIVPALWAAILAYVTFPAYTFFHKRVKLSPNLSSLLMTVTITLVIGLPLLFGLFILQQEALGLYAEVIRRIKAGYLDVPDTIKELPVIGQTIKDELWRINRDPDAALLAIKSWLQSHIYYGKLAFDVMITSMTKLGMALMTLFFFYRDGINLVHQIRRALLHIIGNRIDGYIDSVGATTQAVVYGIGLTAVAQAFLAGIGYYFAGAPSPILLGLVTLVIALIPFGTPFAWGSVSLYLLSQGHIAEGVGLAIWGTAVISWVDNLIRPIVISGATQIPFIIIFVGVLGGLTAFGMVGLFTGPVVLAIALAVWREWINQNQKIIFAPCYAEVNSREWYPVDSFTELDISPNMVTFEKYPFAEAPTTTKLLKKQQAQKKKGLFSFFKKKSDSKNND